MERYHCMERGEKDEVVEIKLPGDAIGKLNWCVGTGAKIKTGEAIAHIITLISEEEPPEEIIVTAPHKGYVKKIFVSIGDDVNPGYVIQF